MILQNRSDNQSITAPQNTVGNQNHPENVLSRYLEVNKAKSQTDIALRDTPKTTPKVNKKLCSAQTEMTHLMCNGSNTTLVFS